MVQHCISYCIDSEWFPEKQLRIVQHSTTRFMAKQELNSCDRGLPDSLPHRVRALLLEHLAMK